MNDLLKLLGKRIHDLRAARKWSQEEFAHVSGLHRTYIGQIERGEKNMSFENLSRVAGALGVTLAVLLDGLEDASPTTPRLPAELGKGPKGATLQLLATQKLVRRLKLQHEEMNRTILALEGVPDKDRRRPKSSSGRPSK